MEYRCKVTVIDKKLYPELQAEYCAVPDSAVLRLQFRMAETQYATVIADSGSTVNMRTKAKSSAALVERVPIGARVEVLGTVGSWTKVKFGSRIGYMMTRFLTAEQNQEPDEDLTLEERVTRLERRVALLEASDGAVG